MKNSFSKTLNCLTIVIGCSFIISAFLVSGLMNPALGSETMQEIYNQDMGAGDRAVVWDRDGNLLHSQGQIHDDYIYWSRDVDVQVYAGETISYYSQRKGYLLLYYLDTNRNLIRQYTFGAYENREVNLDRDGYLRFPQGVYASEYNKLTLIKRTVYPTLNVTCSASPNPAYTNQTVTFTASPSGGTGSYTYSWSGACSGSSQSCSNSFTTAGTKNATVTVTSGTQTTSANCSVVVNQQNIPLSVSVSVSPNPANVNQTVSFTAVATGGTSSYTYSWSGACTGSSSTCQNSFSNPGTYSAAVLVTSGTQSQAATGSVTVNQSCNPNSYRQCYNNDLYWYDSCGVRGSLSQDCGEDGWTNNYQCSGNWLQRQRVDRGCSGSSCFANNIWENYQYCSQGCQNNQCNNYSNLTVSCSVSPNPAYTNQTVTFTASPSGGTGSYTYSWSGACSGSSQSCSNSFSYSGTQYAYLTVTSGSQTGSANCSVTINQQSNNYLRCYNNDLYWFDSYGNRQGFYQDCGETSCDTTGYNYCVGNSVYQQRTCYSRGCAGNACYNTSYSTNTVFIQTCSSGQTCQNGYCTNTCECTSGPCCDGCHYKNTYSICNTETQQEYGCPWGSACGSDTGVRTKTRNQYCSGYSAQCTGAWSGWTNFSNWSVVNYCSTSQTCFYGNPICQTTATCAYQPAYILHYLKKCYDSDVYWYDSDNIRQDRYRDCNDNNTCTIDGCAAGKCSNELKCDGTTCPNGSADYCSSCDHIGDGTCNCGENIASSPQDCGIIGLALTLFGKRENDTVEWSKNFTATASQKVDFLAVVSNGQDTAMNNVTVRVDLYPELIYKGDLRIDGVSSNADIRTGINLGTLNSKTTKTLTFKGEVVPESSLTRNETDVMGTVSTSAGSSTDNLKIILTRGGGSTTTTQTKGFLAALFGVNFNKPVYILLGIIIVILVIMAIRRIMRTFKKEA